MRHVNEVLQSTLELFAEVLEDDPEKRRIEAHRQGIAKARRILGMEPAPEDQEAA